MTMTDKIEIMTLYSGSSGNSVYIRRGEDAILIDGGKTCAALVRAITSVGGDIRGVRAVFVTHEHRDHISALDVASKKYGFTVHMTERSHAALCQCRLRDTAVTHPLLFSVDVCGMTVKSFPTHHDSASSVGYTVSFDGAEYKLGLLTDTGHVTADMTEALSGCTHVILESNHDTDMLMRGPYPFYLKERILSPRGHLSNDAASAFAAELARRGTRSFLLAHISKENNTPQLAYDTTACALEGTGLPFSLSVAAADEPCRVL